jgi:hypothetical protein
VRAGRDTSGRWGSGLGQEGLDLGNRLAHLSFQFGGELDWLDTTLLGVAQLAADVEASLTEPEEVIAELESLCMLGAWRALHLTDDERFVLVRIGRAASEHVDLHARERELLAFAGIR